MLPQKTDPTGTDRACENVVGCRCAKKNVVGSFCEVFSILSLHFYGYLSWHIRSLFILSGLTKVVWISGVGRSCMDAPDGTSAHTTLSSQSCLFCLLAVCIIVGQLPPSLDGSYSKDQGNAFLSTSSFSVATNLIHLRYLFPGTPPKREVPSCLRSSGRAAAAVNRLPPLLSMRFQALILSRPLKVIIVPAADAGSVRPLSTRRANRPRRTRREAAE